MYNKPKISVSSEQAQGMTGFDASQFMPKPYEATPSKPDLKSALDLPSLAFAVALNPSDGKHVKSVFSNVGVHDVKEIEAICETPLFVRTLQSAVKAYGAAGDEFSAINRAAATALVPVILARSTDGESSLKEIVSAFKELTSNAGLAKSNQAPAVQVNFMSTKNMHPCFKPKLTHLEITDAEEL